MIKIPSVNEQMDLIRRGVENIIPEEELEKKLKRSAENQKPLQIKLGCDPSRPDLHIGHAVVLRKLSLFQDLGHDVTLVIGDFTGMIGDPTGRNKTRPQLTLSEAKENAQSYLDQATVILNPEKLKMVNNSTWLNKLNFVDVINLSSKYTIAQMLERDSFSKRYKNGVPISIHEFMYPLAQGYDSVFLKSDVELGGTDQHFNLLVGRELQREFGQEPQIVITTPLIEGTDGVEKMSKSHDNYIGLTETPDQMYGKTLSIPDNLIAKWFEYCTNISNNKLLEIKNDLKNDVSNPRDLKRLLAREIVAVYYDRGRAEMAEMEFDKLFIDKEMPDEMPEYKLTEPEKLVEILVKNKLIDSNGAARRLIKQGAVKLDGTKIDDIFHKLVPGETVVIKAGKRKFLKVV